MHAGVVFPKAGDECAYILDHRYTSSLPFSHTDDTQNCELSVRSQRIYLLYRTPTIQAEIFAMLDQSLSNSSSPDKQLDSGLVLGMHRGALDRDFVTSLPPKEVMQRVDETLRAMGIEVEPESKCNYSCARPKRASVEEGGDVEKSVCLERMFRGGM